MWNTDLSRVMNCVVPTAVVILLSSCAAHSAPSASVQTALAVSRPAIHIEIKELVAAVRDLRQSLASARGLTALPSLGIERTAAKTAPATINVAAGTFSQQLDQLLAAYHYVWFADGDWLNLVPGGVATDPSYIYNLKVPGEVVCSRDSSKATRLSDWIEKQNFTVGQSWHTFGSISPPKEKSVLDPIVLVNPTWRQVSNAHHTVWGDNFWTAVITPVTTESGSPSAPTKYDVVTEGHDIGGSADGSH
jgi:hypothetical protein